MDYNFILVTGENSFKKRLPAICYKGYPLLGE